MLSLYSPRVLVVHAAIAAAAAVAPLQAQSRPSSIDTMVVGAGARIRVSALTLMNPGLVGRLEAVRGDSLWIRYGPTAPPFGLPRAAITNLEVSRGTPGWRAHALIGAALGAVAGAVFVYAVGGGGGCVDCLASEQHSPRPRAALFFGALGGVGGLLAGSTFGREAWQPGRLPPM